MGRRVIEIFNRYLHFGGEESSVDKIQGLLGSNHEVWRMPLDSREWQGPGAPGMFGQAWRTIYNPGSRRRLEEMMAEIRPDFLLLHNVFPVGSPSVYHAAHRLRVPVLQYAHNYRPFSVGGTLFVGGKNIDEPLRGRYWREIRQGAWRDSVVKSAVFALALKLLHRSGWLDSVKAWICVSAFMREKFVESGLPPATVHALPHAWEPMMDPPPAEDDGYYLFLGRLVNVKGVETLCQCWNRLASTTEAKPPELRIAGEGPLEGVVRETAARHSHIRYLGMISGEAKRDALSRCRAVVIPSVWWEPFGLVTCEAYDHGKPVIAAASGGLSETVIHGATGLLHAPGDADDLARKVSAMENMTADERAAMGAAGRKWLSDHLSVENWKRRFEDIIKSALG